MMNLFKHSLCIDFGKIYELDKEEAERFNEAFCHFHKIMTTINGEYIRNALWLQDCFYETWNLNTPKEMLDVCIGYAVQDNIEMSKRKMEYEVHRI